MDRVIQNFEALAENELRTDALEIAEAGYAAIQIGASIRRKVQVKDEELSVDGKTYPIAGKRIFFIGIGKCALAAAEAIESIFGKRLTGGIALGVATGQQTNYQLTTIKVIEGTHPLPSEANVRGTERIIALLSGCREDDLVIMLVSGGGSALLCLPESPMTYADEPSTKSDLVLGESALFQELTARGAPIQDMNIVRKHISRARGGCLAGAAYPAEIISLIVSDVPGNGIASISSGPTVLDSSTIADAEGILAKYGITPSKSISLLETPKEAKYFERVSNILFLSNQDALVAMKGQATQRGYTAEIVDDRFSGEARDIGRAIVEKLHAAAPKTALLYAGESTVTNPSRSGTGGRNQEMALAALADIRDGELILPFASDGHDNTDHAGAIGDAISVAHASAHDLSISEYLDAHRSYDFFSTTGDALLTGYTGSNVSDLIIALKN